MLHTMLWDGVKRARIVVFDDADRPGPQTFATSRFEFFRSNSRAERIEWSVVPAETVLKKWDAENFLSSAKTERDMRLMYIFLCYACIYVFPFYFVKAACVETDCSRSLGFNISNPQGLRKKSGQKMCRTIIPVCVFVCVCVALFLFLFLTLGCLRWRKFTSSCAYYLLFLSLSSFLFSRNV